MTYRRLSSRFFRRPSDELARRLLGKTLVRGGRAGVIVETEAYLGPEDLASHARFGRTKRNAVMFGPGGAAYVYLCYGMYDLFNVVSGRDGQPGAVLIRGLEPGCRLGGDMTIARGPGKLTRALGITRAHTGMDLATNNKLFIAHGRRVAAEQIAMGPRVGVDYAGAWTKKPLRFWIVDHPSVSRMPSKRTRARRG